MGWRLLSLKNRSAHGFSDGRHPETSFFWQPGRALSQAFFQTVRIIKTSARTRSAVNEQPIESAYLHSFRLAPGGRHIAFVRRSEGKDYISVLDVQTRKVSSLSRSDETGLYISGLNWSSDGTRVFFSRQETIARVVSLEKPADRKTNR